MTVNYVCTILIRICTVNKDWDLFYIYSISYDTKLRCSSKIAAIQIYQKTKGLNLELEDTLSLS